MKIKKYVFFVVSFLVLKTTCSEVDYFSGAPKDIFFKIVDCCLEQVYQSSIKKLKKSCDFVNFKNFHPVEQLKNEITFSILTTLSFVSKKFALQTREYVTTKLATSCSHEDIFRYQVATNKTLCKNLLFLPADLKSQAHYKVQTQIFHEIQWISLYNDLSKHLEAYISSPYLQKTSLNTLNYSIKTMNNEILNFLKDNKVSGISKVLPAFLKGVDSDKFPWFKKYIESNGEIVPKSLDIKSNQHHDLSSSEKIKFGAFLKRHRSNCLKNEKNFIALLKKKKNSQNRKENHRRLVMRHLILLHSIKKESNTQIYKFLKKISNYCWYNPI